MNIRLRHLMLLLASAVSPFGPILGSEPNDLPQLSTTKSTSQYLPAWGIEFGEVPELLRMHVPALRSGSGIVVQRIDDGDAPAAGLQVGDVLMAIDVVSIASVDQLPQTPQRNLTVLRRGRIVPLGVMQSSYSSVPFALPRLPGVSVSAFASGNESVSVSQNGNEILIEMSLPELASKPIRYRGTAEQIRREVQRSNLPPAARERVLEAIR